MTDIEQLKIELDKITYYPPGLEKVNCGIPGKGFFPGARGLDDENDQTISNKPIMILGHDFGTKVDYLRSKERGCESLEALTWNNLSKMLVKFNIEQKDCFFTNAIMGMRVLSESKTKISAIGKSIAYQYPEYLNACKNLLLKQIELQKPNLVIILGIHVIEFISCLSPQLNDLKKIKTYKGLDKANLSLIKNVTFQKIKDYTTTFVFITHPTYWHLNSKRRKVNEEELVKTILW